MCILVRRVAITGYWAYGLSVQSNILFSLMHPRGVIALASAMVIVHVLGSWQVRASSGSVPSASELVFAARVGMAPPDVCAPRG